MHYGTPIAATLVNFIAGAIVLWTAWLVKVAVAGPGNPLPAEWWYYLGGPMGCVFIGLARCWSEPGGAGDRAGMIAGQLLGSLGLDLVVPAPGTVVALPTVLAPLLTLAAIVLATLPWPRRRLRSGSGAGRLGHAAFCTSFLRTAPPGQRITPGTGARNRGPHPAAL